MGRIPVCPLDVFVPSIIPVHETEQNSERQPRNRLVARQRKMRIIETIKFAPSFAITGEIFPFASVHSIECYVLWNLQHMPLAILGNPSVNFDTDHVLIVVPLIRIPLHVVPVNWWTKLCLEIPKHFFGSVAVDARRLEINYLAPGRNASSDVTHWQHSIFTALMVECSAAVRMG